MPTFHLIQTIIYVSGGQGKHAGQSSTEWSAAVAICTLRVVVNPLYFRIAQVSEDGHTLGTAMDTLPARSYICVYMHQV